MATSSSIATLFIVLLFGISEAKEFLVGVKENSWTILTPLSESLNPWAEKIRFTVGDVLKWEQYDSTSVMKVSGQESYWACNTTSPIEEYKDGNNTKVDLDHEGPFYFISGSAERCKMGHHLQVIVLSAKTSKPKASLLPHSAPAPAPTGPAPQPAAACPSLIISACGLTMGMFVSILFIGLIWV